MAVPTAPLELSAEATKPTTIELRWSIPTSDGGDTITGYFIERSLNGASFSTLVADTGSTVTAHSDTTLSARDNGKYRVSAINSSGTGVPSDTDSSTTGTSEAQTIKDLLFNSWALTGELSKTVVGDMDEVVHFFDRGQIPGNKKAKAVTVQKINTLGNEIVVEHPKFSEQSDIFEVTCLLQVPDGADDRFSVAIDLMQQMTGEVTRILKTKYSPSTTTGEFFRTNSSWTKDNTFFPDDPMLVRTLKFTLTRIVGTSTKDFLGFGGVLVFDTSASTADSKPGSDFTYATVRKVNLREGYSQNAVLTKDTILGKGVPEITRSVFSGIFSAEMYATKDDFVGSTINQLDKIYKLQNNSPQKNQNAEVVFLHSNPNTEGTPTKLTTQSFMKINEINKISENENLLLFSIAGTLTRPTIFTEAT